MEEHLSNSRLSEEYSKMREKLTFFSKCFYFTKSWLVLFQGHFSECAWVVFNWKSIIYIINRGNACEEAYIDRISQDVIRRIQGIVLFWGPLKGKTNGRIAATM